MKQYTVLTALFSVMPFLAYAACGDAYIIQQSNMPYTITQEGYYCLAESVIGQITIDASKVTLNLSGRSVSLGDTPLVINNNRSEIVMRDGIITGTGIIINNAIDVTLQNIDFIGSTTANSAITANNSTWITVDACTFRNYTATVVTMNNCESSTVRKSLFTDNITDVIVALNSTTNMECSDLKITDNGIKNAQQYAAGILFVNSSYGTVSNCTIASNITANAVFYGAVFFSACSHMKVQNCTVSNNATPGLCAGFLAMDDSTHILFDGCLVNHLRSIGQPGILSTVAIGFFLQGTYYSISNCVVRDTEGSSDAGGIFAGNTTNCIFRNNTFVNNVGGVNSYGIYTGSGVGSLIWSNVAQGHIQNFTGSMPIVSYDSATGIFNIYGTSTPTTPTPYDNIDIA